MVELLFFIAIIYSIEKILIRLISLSFHAVAYADRLKVNAFALATIDKLKDYKPRRKRPKTNASNHYFVPLTGGSGGISGISTTAGSMRPAFHSNNSTAPPTPDLLEQKQSFFSPRLTFSAMFKSTPRQHQDDNAIPLQIAPHHFEHQPPNSRKTSELRTPATPGTPGTPGTPDTGASAFALSDGKQSSRYTQGKGARIARELAMQAMIDPLQTLHNPTLMKNGLGLDFASASDGVKLAKDLFYAFRSTSSRDFLITSDFHPAFPTQKEAEAAFAVFDKDGNGDISRSGQLLVASERETCC